MPTTSTLTERGLFRMVRDMYDEDILSGMEIVDLIQEANRITHGFNRTECVRVLAESRVYHNRYLQAAALLSLQQASDENTNQSEDKETTGTVAVEENSAHHEDDE